MKFAEIINQQVSQKHKLIRTVSPPPGGFTIIIQENKIKEVVKGPGWVHPTRMKQYCALFNNCLKKYNLPDSNININLVDHPHSGYFNFCRNISMYSQFLLPNHRFTEDDILPVGVTFDNTIEYLRSNWIPFESRKPAFYTNCIPHPSKVDYFKYALNNLDICKGHIYGGSVHKYVKLESSFINKLVENELAGTEHKPFEEHIKYKYIVYNDGNTLSDRTRLLLNTDSVIIRKDSPYEEFYTYLLKPYENYIPYLTADELRTIHTQLENDTDLCNKIRNNNKIFVDTYLRYDDILEYVANLMIMLYT